MSNYEYFETVAICMGDSLNEENNLTRKDAEIVAIEFLKNQKNNNMNIINGIIKKPQKIIIYGEPGAGKSTLGSQFPNSLFVDVEHSANQLNVSRVIVNNWNELISVLDDCKSSQFDTIVVDTLDIVESFCATRFNIQILALNDYGRSFVALEEYFNKYIISALNALIENGKNVVLLAHNEVKKIELPENEGQYDRHEMRLTKRVKALFEGWCDALFFIYRKSFVVENENGKNKATGGKKRWIETNSNTICVAKCRWQIEDNFEVNIDKILPYLPTANSANESAKSEVTQAPAQTDSNNESTNIIQKFKDFLALDLGFTESEILTYLYGKNSKKTVFIKMGTPFNGIPENIINSIMKPQNWEKVRKDLINNREVK